VGAGGVPQEPHAVLKMERADINALLFRFGESVRCFFRSEQRAHLLSPVFHLPGRLILGSYCYYEQAVPLLRRVAEHAPPEELGDQAKRFGARPNGIHINSLLLGYLNGREQRRLLGHPLRDDSEDLGFLLDFWTRFLSVYRADGRLLPEESGFTWPVLTRDALEVVLPKLHSEFDQERRRRIHRALAMLELFTFVFNGEARVGVFHHGPYSWSEGDCLPEVSMRSGEGASSGLLRDPEIAWGTPSVVVKELVGLRDDFYSWAEESVWLPVENLVYVMVVKDVVVRIGLFGSLWTEPREYHPHIIAHGIFTARAFGGDPGEELRPVALEELEEIAACAAEAQMRLYRRFLTWDARRRLAYGAELYGNLLRVFGDGAGLGVDFHREIRERFQESTDRHLEALLAGEPPAILHHIATTEGAIYSPLGGG